MARTVFIGHIEGTAEVQLDDKALLLLSFLLTSLLVVFCLVSCCASSCCLSSLSLPSSSVTMVLNAVLMKTASATLERLRLRRDCGRTLAWLSSRECGTACCGAGRARGGASFLCFYLFSFLLLGIMVLYRHASFGSSKLMGAAEVQRDYKAACCTFFLLWCCASFCCLISLLLHFPSFTMTLVQPE